MMRVNPEPVIFDLETLVQNLSYMADHYYFSMDSFLMMTKKEVKEQIQSLANYMCYNYEGYEMYDYENDEDFSQIKERVRAKVLKVFPEFEVNEDE